jgi:serine/threonine protein phosphatase PrpC
VTGNIQIYYINKIGKRDSLEDSILYVPLNDLNHLFIVCDGVGSSSKGEVASKLACESIASYFKSEVHDDPNENDIQNSLRFTEYINDNPDCKGMATTLALLFLNSEKGIKVTKPHC